MSEQDEIMKKINSEVMGKIRSGEIKMKPKAYFIVGSFAMVGGLILSFISVTFVVNLIFFLSRAHGPMRDFRLNAILESLPWWIPVLAIFSVVTGLILLKKYDFSYQKNFYLILTGIVFALLGTAWLLDYTKLNDLWFKRGPIGQYFNGQGFRDGRGQGQGLRKNQINLLQNK